MWWHWGEKPFDGCQRDERQDKAGGDVSLARKHIRTTAQLSGQVSAVLPSFGNKHDGAVLSNTDIGVMLYELLRTFNLLIGWATAAGQCDVDKLQVLAVILQQK